MLHAEANAHAATLSAGLPLHQLPMLWQLHHSSLLPERSRLLAHLVTHTSRQPVPVYLGIDQQHQHRLSGYR